MEPQNLLITSYNNFSCLAHIPTGTQNKKPLLFKNSIIQSEYEILECYNPAFVLKNPDYNILYICCESIESGHILTLEYDSNFQTKVLSVIETGKSSCYLALDSSKKNLIAISYWDSVITVHPMKVGIPQKYIFMTSNGGNIDCGLQDHLHNRQQNSHFHSVAIYKQFLLIPDLGLDVIHFYLYQPEQEKMITKLGIYSLPSGSGPRYLSLRNNYLYVVNELNSTVMVFKIIEKHSGLYLEEVQTISTIPDNYQGKNTCGNICVHPKLPYLAVSNRGHDSITIYKINQIELQFQKNISTLGKTPRHFSFDLTGKLLMVANQDSDSVVIFNFHEGEVSVNQQIQVNSPNFVIEI